LILSLSLSIDKKIRDMKDVLVFAAAVIGGTMIFFGNDWGLVGLIPALIQTVKDAKTI
jgi:hypothetical protein